MASAGMATQLGSKDRRVFALFMAAARDLGIAGDHMQFVKQQILGA